MAGYTSNVSQHIHRPRLQLGEDFNGIGVDQQFQSNVSGLSKARTESLRKDD